MTTGKIVLDKRYWKYVKAAKKKNLTNTRSGSQDEMADESTKFSA